jgi:hypothetical protein
MNSFLKNLHVPELHAMPYVYGLAIHHSFEFTPAYNGAAAGWSDPDSILHLFNKSSPISPKPNSIPTSGSWHVILAWIS